MKKIIFSMAVMIASIGAYNSFAQNPESSQCQAQEQCHQKRSPREMRENKDVKRHENLFCGITLTPEQTVKINRLKEDAKEREQRIMRDAKAKSEKSQQDFQKDVKKVLTSEQYQKFEENVKASEQRAEKRAKRAEMAVKKGGRDAKDFVKREGKKAKSDLKKGERKVKEGFEKGKNRVKAEERKLECKNKPCCKKEATEVVNGEINEQQKMPEQKPLTE